MYSVLTWTEEEQFCALWCLLTLYFFAKKIRGYMFPNHCFKHPYGIIIMKNPFVDTFRYCLCRCCLHVGRGLHKLNWWHCRAKKRWNHLILLDFWQKSLMMLQIAYLFLPCVRLIAENIRICWGVGGLLVWGGRDRGIDCFFLFNAYVVDRGYFFMSNYFGLFILGFLG